MDWHFVVQACIAMYMITFPSDPVEILFFNSIIGGEEHRRVSAALRVCFAVGVTLGLAALVGGEFLDLLGINLGAFSVIGGLVVGGMGFEMLYGGGPSVAQGMRVEEEGPTGDSGLFLPLSTPLIAGPGAITTAITVSASQGADSQAVVATLIGVAVVIVAVFISFVYLGGLLGRIRQNTLQLLTRLGGCCWPPSVSR